MEQLHELYHKLLKQLEKKLRIMHERWGHSQSYRWAQSYINDAKYFYMEGNVVDAVLALEYAYGLLDSLLLESGEYGEEET